MSLTAVKYSGTLSAGESGWSSMKVIILMTQKEELTEDGEGDDGKKEVVLIAQER